MGVLLALAHEFDMPILTLRINRMLMLPAGYLEDEMHATPPPDGCSDFMKVRCFSTAPDSTLSSLSMVTLIANPQVLQS